MYKNLICCRAVIIAAVATVMLVPGPLRSAAQLSLSGQIRARAEARKGYANLLRQDASSAFFISQRTRLTFNYKIDHLLFGAALQDVRIWGQDAATVSAADGNRLMLHEGWAEIALADRSDTSFHLKWIDRLSLKIGRQELVFDDARLIGNLDWAQQGRRFDMALLKAAHRGWQLDLAYAYNQNGERFSGNAYTPGNVSAWVKNDAGALVQVPGGMVPLLDASENSSPSGTPAYSNPPNTNGGNQNYKQFLGINLVKKIGETRISALFFKDDFAKYRAGSVALGGGTLYGRFFDVKGKSSRYTTGIMLNSAFAKTDRRSIALQAGGYLQSGADRDGKALNACHYTLSATYSGRNITVGPGYDVLSGNKSSTPVTRTRRFDPLYGTPHKFWGTMDYFYAGTGSPAGGLKDYYIRSKLTAGRVLASADLHRFDLANASSVASAKLGDELDLSLNYQFGKFAAVELGHSMMYGTSALLLSKGQSPAAAFRKSGKWSYLAISIRPDFNAKSK